MNGTCRPSAGRGPATAEDIAAVAATLRPMTLGEVEVHLVERYRGVDTPILETPGL
ncbi:hypothetical protein [Microbacterium sp. 18062]|uniref:hypothetical protein n=1 Tax=Microbacterium sp. 18062 TaxID=2681410 RepID=UPI0013578E78|nr:hypothetical protein [Microbacterium sp. 18062]